MSDTEERGGFDFQPSLQVWEQVVGHLETSAWEERQLHQKLLSLNATQIFQIGISVALASLDQTKSLRILQVDYERSCNL